MTGRHTAPIPSTPVNHALLNAISLAENAIPNAIQQYRISDPDESHIKRLGVTVSIWVLEELLAAAKKGEK